ncbi:MAG: glycogen/starch/alpha-glucan phosphorylase [Clostridia bacterium]|nr:glycogen/starch/alpha-glucan phosphorylase [Clostridia bacterium]
MNKNSEENRKIDEITLKEFVQILENRYLKGPDTAKPEEINDALAQAVMNLHAGNRRIVSRPAKGVRRAYYLSAEFLVGRAVYNNLLALGLDKSVSKLLRDAGSDYDTFENIEDAGLGNGGLGRLAACFADSAAALKVPFVGYGIRYKYGIFKQQIENGCQVEAPHDWTKWGDPWSLKVVSDTQRVSFDDLEVLAVPYDMPVFGYRNDHATYIRLWEAHPTTPFDFELFNKQKYDAALAEKNAAENISRVLYPADDTDEGKKLRLRQQYFFASASLKDVICRYKEAYGNDFSHFAEENIFQLNDTHPVVAIPEFLRIMCEEEHTEFTEALDIAKKCFAYTNHTVMSEALEKWDVKLFESILSRVYKYVERLDSVLEGELSDKDITSDEAEAMKIICDGRICMANIALFICTRVNGVAAIHTDILKRNVFANWNRIYPGKIINITNGITQRRWLGVANPELAAFTTRLLGDDKWLCELSRISGLAKYANDSAAREDFNSIKRYRRRVLSDLIREREGKLIDPDSVFDIQIKRIHEYKRQLLNALAVLEMYFEIKDGTLKNIQPVSVIFGGKAAPGYRRAKSVIKLICELERLIAADEQVSKYLNVHFITGYNVSYAEKLVGAADLSEQISTAGTEASGTGNMKMMLNGALTLGTLDGANVEIVKEAGKENNYIFGALVEEIERIRSSYDPIALYEKDARIKRVLDALKDGTLDDGGSGDFADLYDSLIIETGADRYFLLYDFDSYLRTKLRAISDFSDRSKTAKMGILNMASSGVFSSDRSIRNYHEKIWSRSTGGQGACEV